MNYVIADIHGGSRTFKTLLERIQLRHDDRLYLLGDYVDRGPDSKGVLDTISRLIVSGYDVRALRGNHDDMLLRMISHDNDELSTPYRVEWGWHTLKSFGVGEPGEICSSYVNLLESLPYLIVEDDYVFVHAGLNMMTVDPLKDTDRLDMLWKRSYDVDRQKIGGRKLVTGHVIDSLDQIRESINGDTIRLDNGAFTNELPDRGNLVALNLTRRELIIQPWCDIEAVF